MEALVDATLRLAAPLWIAALGELVVQRSGVLNVGIEGMMLTGAFVAFAVTIATGSPGLGVVAAATAASALGALFAAFAVSRKADPIVVGMALNGLALGATGLASRALWTGSVPVAPAASTLALPGSDALPALGPLLARQSPFVLLAIGLTVAVAFGLGRTRAGLRLRAVGEAARAADAEGVSVERTRWVAIGIGASLAGVGGSVLTLSQSNTFTEGMTAGRGFIALTIVIFGAWRPLGIVAACLFFGAAMALQFRLQARGIDVPYPVFLMLPYLLTLVALTTASGRARAPADLGRPYHREAPS